VVWLDLDSLIRNTEICIPYLESPLPHALTAYFSTWNTVVYCPMLQLSFFLLPVPSFILEPSVYQTSPTCCRNETRISIHLCQGIWQWNICHRHVSVPFCQFPSVRCVHPFRDMYMQRRESKEDFSRSCRSCPHCSSNTQASQPLQFPKFSSSCFTFYPSHQTVVAWVIVVGHTTMVYVSDVTPSLVSGPKLLNVAYASPKCSVGLVRYLIQVPLLCQPVVWS
jgi:hypothetical protein